LQDQYRLSFATNGKKALGVASKVKPDIILLDIMMPDLYVNCPLLPKRSFIIHPALHVPCRPDLLVKKVFGYGAYRAQKDRDEQ